MTVEPTPTPFPGNRIVGEVTPARELLLQRIDAIVAEGVYARRPHFTTWDLYAVLTDTPSRRSRGYVVALRAEPKPGLTLGQAGEFPWQHLAPIASRIVSEVWEATRVVPDVATAAPYLPPALNEHPPEAGVFDDGWPLSA